MVRVATIGAVMVALAGFASLRGVSSSGAGMMGVSSEVGLWASPLIELDGRGRAVLVLRLERDGAMRCFLVGRLGEAGAAPEEHPADADAAGRYPNDDLDWPHDFPVHCAEGRWRRAGGGVTVRIDRSLGLLSEFGDELVFRPRSEGMLLHLGRTDVPFHRMDIALPSLDRYEEHIIRALSR